MADLSRLEYLVGPEKMKIISGKYVLLCGCGGVGSFVAEALCRSGLGHITLLDHDKVESSNLNRQLMSQKDNIGISKTKALKNRIEVVSDTEVDTLDVFIDDDFVLDKQYDYVIDCIDTLSGKFRLVKVCDEAGVPLICSLGSARRMKPEKITLTTLDKTRNDPLAKAFRSLVKKHNFRKKIEVVFTDTPAIKTNIIKEGKTNKEKYPLGSSIFVVGSVGLYIASVVFERLTGEDKNDIQ